MLTKKQEFNILAESGSLSGKVLFRPILMHFAARHHGVTYGDLASDYRKLVEANIHCMEDFDTDMVGLISDPYRETAAFGAPVKFIPEGVPVCEKKIIQSLEDVRSLKNPDVKKEERTLDRIKGAEYYQHLLKGNVPVIGWVEGPLAEACNLAGVDTILMNMMLDPDMVRLLLDKCLITAIDFAEAQVESGCDIIGIGDAICSQVDAGLYEAFVKELHKKLIASIHEKGAKVKMHICGNINHLLPSLSGLGIDILDIDWQVSPEDAYQVMGPETIRCGNINPVNIQDHSLLLLEDEVTNLLSKEKDRRFILSGGCEITVLTPKENLHVLSNLSKKL